MDKDYHLDCFGCEQCGCELIDERCFPIEDKLFCYECYFQYLELFFRDYSITLDNI